MRIGGAIFALIFALYELKEANVTQGVESDLKRSLKSQ